MLKSIPLTPAKFKRRQVSATRNFPKGCRVLVSEPGSNPTDQTPPPAVGEPEHAKLEPLSNHPKEEPKEEPEESHGSTMPEKEPKMESEEDEGSGRVNGKLEASGESHGLTLPTKGIEERSEEDEGLDRSNVELKASELPEASEAGGGGEIRGNEDTKLPTLSLNKFRWRKSSQPKRRKVPAVRQFPSGCVRIVIKIGLEESVMAASSESKTGGKKPAAGVGSTKEEGEDENVGIEAAVESAAKDQNLEIQEPGGKPDGKKPAEGVRYTTKDKEEDDDDEVRKSDVKSEEFFESSSEEDEDDEGKKNAEPMPMPIRERKVQNSFGEPKFKSPKPRFFEANTSVKLSSGAKVVDKGRTSSIRKPIGNVNTLKRKATEEIEDEGRVMGAKSRGKQPLDTYGDRSIVPNPGAPKFKAKDKLKMFSGSASVPQTAGDGRAVIVSKKSKPPCFPSHPKSDGASPRDMVKRTLRLFQKLVQEDETRSKGTSRVDLNAASILKKSNNWVNHGEPIIGDVPGVEAGDEFHYRVELSIIGLHRPFQGGIDFMKRRDGTILATSIVASGGYPDGLENSGELIYSGSGGNPDAKKKKEAGDQKLERGNLALKNSIDAKSPVRVIYGSKEQHGSTYRDGRAKAVTTFTYDGLYLVEDYWSETGPRGFSVYKFRLRRLSRTQNTQESPIQTES